MTEICIRSMVLGSVATNVFFLQNEETKELILIDPADSAHRIRQAVAQLEGKPAAILLTHAHFDHILAAKELQSAFQIPVYVEESDEKMLGDARLNLSASWQEPFTMKADHTVREGDVLKIAGLEIRVLHTPGHTAGSCCYYLPENKVLFSGDTLFCGSYGRTDFPTSSMRDMVDSVCRLLRELPEDVKVLPGHDSFTTIGDEKRYNPLAAYL